MIRIILIFCLFFISTKAEAAVFPERPPVPPSYELEEEVAIVETSPNELVHVQQKLQRMYPHVHIRQIYETALSGFSVQGRRRDLRELKELDGVARVTPVSTYQADINESVPFIGGNVLRSYFDETGRRITGKGIRVGVIDTGIDYHHPDLRRSYAGGYDTVDRDGDPMESKIAGEAEATQHGSHVAGIIAANGRMKGVAPDAKIFAYRALGPGGVGSTETVLAAIEQAMKDQVDVLNLSLGNDVNGPDWPTSTALNRVVEKGMIAITASGNSGPGVWTVGSPATSAQAIAVGASTPRLRVPYLRVNGKELQLTPLAGASWEMDRSYEWVRAGLGKKGELKGVENKIALIKRGELSFSQKVQNAQKAGAKAVIIYNNESGSFTGMVTKANIPVASLSGKEGVWLLKQAPALVRTVFHQEEDRLADFSSRGPVTVTWDIKPDVVAPGVAITSTVPNGYMAMQGTSMAAPHVAGAAALLKQAHPDWRPEQVKAALMNSAKLLYRGATPYRVYEQGAGRIQLERALYPPFLVYPSSLAFSLVRASELRTVRSVIVTIENETNKVQTYSFAAPPYQQGIQWRLPHTLYIGPHEVRRVTIGVEINASLLQRGVHEGYLYVKNADRDVALPYLFFIEEPNYPRMTGFQLVAGDAPGMYRYEMYLPGGADEMGIVLYDPSTFSYVDYLLYRQNVTSGRIKETILAKQSLKGTYKALVFVKKGKREDILETMIDFP